MTLKRFILALLLVEGITCAGFAAAQMGSGSMGMPPPGGEGGHGQGGPMMPGRMGPPHGDPLSPESLRGMLGLSDDQVQKMRQLRMEYEKETIRKGADIRVGELEMKDLLEQKNVDLAQVEKKVRQLEALRGDLMLVRVRSMLKAKDFLNDQQFDRFKQMVLLMASHRMGGMHGPMMRGGPPGDSMGMMQERGGEYPEEGPHESP